MCDQRPYYLLCQDNRHKPYVTGAGARAPFPSVFTVRQAEGGQEPGTRGCTPFGTARGPCGGGGRGAGGGPGPPLCQPLVMVGRVLSYSHRDTTTRIEATARRALLTSNSSYALLWSLVEGRTALEAQQELEDR